MAGSRSFAVLEVDKDFTFHFLDGSQFVGYSSCEVKYRSLLKHDFLEMNSIRGLILSEASKGR